MEYITLKGSVVLIPFYLWEKNSKWTLSLEYHRHSLESLLLKFRLNTNASSSFLSRQKHETFQKLFNEVVCCPFIQCGVGHQNSSNNNKYCVWMFTNKFIEIIWYIIILMHPYVWQCERSTDSLEFLYDMVTIILLLMTALFFIQLYYINLSIHYVPQASSFIWKASWQFNLIKHVCHFKMQYIYQSI